MWTTSGYSGRGSCNENADQISLRAVEMQLEFHFERGFSDLLPI